MHRAIRVLLIFSFAVAATAVLAQEDFSADVVNTRNGKTDSGAKMFITKDKMRFESQDKNPRNGGGVVIVNLTTQTSTILMTERKMYMEFPQGQGPGGQRMMNFFQARDIENACADWLQLAYNKGGTCKKIGSDTVDGRSTVHYQGTNSKGETGDVWLDKKIAFPIKWQNSGGEGGLQNIKEGSQPASLFEVPADYQKFQMPAGMPGMPGMQSPH
jgi:hypothetical protein